MSLFLHPSKEDITLHGVLYALGDPLRLSIVQKLLKKDCSLSCSEASPYNSIPKSTLSHHFRILRESGLVRTTKQGVEHRNELRVDDMEEKFPGLLKVIFQYSEFIEQ